MTLISLHQLWESNIGPAQHLKYIYRTVTSHSYLSVLESLSSELSSWLKLPLSPSSSHVPQIVFACHALVAYVTDSHISARFTRCSHLSWGILVISSCSYLKYKSVCLLPHSPKAVLSKVCTFWGGREVHIGTVLKPLINRYRSTNVHADAKQNRKQRHYNFFLKKRFLSRRQEQSKAKRQALHSIAAQTNQQAKSFLQSTRWQPFWTLQILQ